MVYIDALLENAFLVVMHNDMHSGGTDMGDHGKMDKGRREQRKKAQLSPEEKRKLKREKKK